MRKPLALGALLALASVAACRTQQDSVADEVVGPPTAIDGTWRGGCARDDDARGSHRLTLSFRGGKGTSSVEEFEDEACRTLVETLTVTVDYVVGEPDGGGVRPLEVTTRAMHLTPATAARATLYNQEAYCDETDWRAGGARSVAGRSCRLRQTDGDTESNYQDVGTVSYTIARIDGASLFMGKQDAARDGSTRDKRPTELDREQPLTRLR